MATALLVMIMCPIVGCSKREAARGNTASQVVGQPNSQAGGTNRGTTGNSDGGTIKLSPVGAGESGAGRSPAPVAAGGASVGGTERLLTMRGGAKILPSDFDIGALQPAMPAGTERGAVLRTIRLFFDDLANGKVDAELLAPEWRDNLVRLLSAPKREGNLPQMVRIGILNIEQDSANAAIRMEKGTGSAAGQIYLERSEGTWYISDIQVDLSTLGSPTVRSEPFDPAEWKAMIKE